MEGLRKFNNPSINFLKGKFAVKFNPVSLIYSTWKHYIILGSFSLAALFLYANIRDYQSEKLLDKISQLFRKKAISITQLQPKSISEQKIRQFINSRKKVIKNLSLTEELSSLPSALDKLQVLSVAINKNKEWNLEIQRLHIADTKVEIRGTILKQHIENFKKNLLDIAQKNSLKTLTQKAESSNNTEKTANDTNPTPPTDNIPFAYVFNQKKGY